MHFEYTIYDMRRVWSWAFHGFNNKILIFAPNEKQTRKEEKRPTGSPHHKRASHISQAVAAKAFSKVHIGHGLVASIGAGEDVAVRSLIVSSGKDSDVQPRANNVPPNPPPSTSRRCCCGVSVSDSSSSSFSCSSRRSRTSLARMLRAATLALLSANS